MKLFDLYFGKNATFIDVYSNSDKYISLRK